MALNGPLLVLGSGSPSPVHLEQYWATSRCRSESWSRALHCAATLAGRSPRDKSDRWVEIRGALDEIFTSEMLTRVWTAVLVARARRQGDEALEPIARSVLGAHLEARRRALAVLLDRDGFSTAQAAAAARADNIFLPAKTAAAARPARGRYIRCSKARSAIGMKLEVGASVRKNQIPRKPAGRFPRKNHTAAASSAATASRAGSAAANVRT